MARSSGVSFTAVCGTCPGDDWQRVEALYNKHADFVRPQFGLHPWWISRYRLAVERLAGGGIEVEEEREVGAKERMDSSVKASNKGKDEGGDHVKISKADIDDEVDQKKNSSKSKSKRVDTSLVDVSQPWDTQLLDHLKRIPSAGVGECGLDRAIKQDVPLELQEEVLKKHIAIARQLGRPVTMHCVGAWGSLLGILREERRSEARADSDREAETEAAEKAGTGSKRKGGRVPSFVLHSCNSMPVEMAGDFAALPGVYFSFTGRALGPKETRLIRAVPPDRILIETDAPDQLPAGLKGRLAANEVCVVRQACVLIARAREIDPGMLASLTADNARRVFDGPFN
jgi:Tat protein secretion system quality control protein TatD with DNase activity